jgi:hypothetical protein
MCPHAVGVFNPGLNPPSGLGSGQLKRLAVGGKRQALPARDKISATALVSKLTDVMPAGGYNSFLVCG